VEDRIRAGRCERARAWTSLALDGELSELERRLHSAHLGRCPACAAFAADLEAIAGTLRATPPVEAETSVAGAWEGPARRRRRTAPAVRVVGSASAAAAAAAAGFAMFTLGAISVHDPKPAPRPAPIVVDATSVVDASQEMTALREARRVVLLAAMPQREAGERSGPNPL
jgi:anti-sigma factor RsiW